MPAAREGAGAAVRDDELRAKAVGLDLVEPILTGRRLLNSVGASGGMKASGVALADFRGTVGMALM
jgi:hypothetical protein